MQHTVKCRGCEAVGTVTIETFAAKSGGKAQRIVTQIVGDFIRTDEVSEIGMPIVRCDRCNASVPVE